MEHAYVEAKVEWTNKNIQKPRIPEEGIRFCPQIKFDEEDRAYPGWTAEVIIKGWGNGSSCYVKLRYLFEHGPAGHLKPGNEFTLYDGINEIARGVILPGDA